MAEIVAESIGLPFNYEWYGTPDNRSYRVNFDKIKKTLNFEPNYSPRDGAKDVFEALKNRKVSPDDPRTITVKWYKHLLEMKEFIKQIEINGTIL